MIAFQFLIAALATYRVAHMIADERGPFDIFHKLRTAVYKRWPDKSYVSYGASVENSSSTYPLTQVSWQFDGITCVDCLSFWLSWVTVLALPVYGADYIISALAISAVCVLINHNSK